MKKSILFFLVFSISTVLVSAYNPPPSGELLHQFSSPELLSGGSLSTGGAFKNIRPESIGINPSLIAGEQRWVVDLGYTAFIGTNDLEGFGSAFLAGFIIPSRYGNLALTMDGIFTNNLVKPHLGNSFLVDAAFAKDLTDDLYLGIGMKGGFGPEGDWALAGDFGFWYRIKSLRFLPFLKDLRWAFSLTNMGKSFLASEVGIVEGKEVSASPSLFTPTIGLAGTLFSTKHIAGGMGIDFSFPTFQNCIADIGFELLVANVFRVKTAWDINIRELMAGYDVSLPSLSLSFKFNFSTKDLDFMQKHGWQENEMLVTTAYKNLYKDVHLASGSLLLFLGQKDFEAPVISLWGEE